MEKIGFYSKKNKTDRSGRRKLSAGMAVLCVLAAALSYPVPAARPLWADALGWIQTDWSGGLDGGVAAISNNDRTTWTKYSAKSGNVTTGTDATLSQPAGSVVQSAAEDFGVDTLDADMRIDAANEALTLKKANGRACTTDAECRESYCLGGVCTDNPFVYGVCTGIGVYPTSAPSNLMWKTADNYCPSPYCVSGQTLVADPSLDYSAYPAQQYCISIGARLPTHNELNCMYTNRVTLGCVTTEYWSNEGVVSGYYYSAYVKSFDSTTSAWWGSRAKNSARAVRCVRNQT